MYQTIKTIHTPYEPNLYQLRKTGIKQHLQTGAVKETVMKDIYTEI